MNWQGKFRLIVKNELPDVMKNKDGKEVPCIIQVGDIWFLNQKNLDSILQGKEKATRQQNKKGREGEGRGICTNHLEPASGATALTRSTGTT